MLENKWDNVSDFPKTEVSTQNMTSAVTSNWQKQPPEMFCENMFLKISWNSQYCVCFFAYLHRCFQHALFPRTELILLYINSKCVTSASEWFWKNKSAIDLVCKVNFWSVYFYSIIILIQIAVLGLPLLFSEIVGFGLIQSMQEFLKAPFLVLHFSINDLPDDVVCNIAICADDSTLYSKCDQASDLWQQLELASELESDLWDIMDWGRKWLVDFNAGKAELVLFDWSNNTGAIVVKVDGSVLEENSSFKMLDLTFSSKLDWGFY